MSYVLPIGYALVAYAVVWVSGMGGFAQPENIAPLAARLGWTITDPARFVPLYFLFVGITVRRHYRDHQRDRARVGRGNWLARLHGAAAA